MRRLAIAPLLLAAAACGSGAAVSPVAGPASGPAGPAAPPAAPPAATTAAPRATAPRPATPARPAGTTPARPKAPAATTPPPAAPPASRPATPPARPATTPAGSLSGDVDGDGRRDTVRLGSGSLTTGRWDLLVTLARGGTVTGTVNAEPQVRPALLGVVDADRDGDGEVFVRVGGGASTTAYTPYTLVEDGMAEVRTGDGAALRLLVGGSVTHGNGFACADLDPAPGRELAVLSVVSDEGTTFRGTRVTYRWRDDRVVELKRTAYRGEQDDPAVRASYEIDCDSL
jgi:hypothetical protein